MNSVKVFAPATIANLGPGFDILGLAVQGVGDIVEATRVDAPGVHIEAIEGDSGRLPRAVTKNTAGIAAVEALKIIGVEAGIALKLYKGMPLGSGLGSSAASAAAAVWAVAALAGFDDKAALLPACLAAEAGVSGYHADNVAPALLGGLVLIEGYNPLRVQSLPTPDSLHLVLVTPDCEIPTAQARSVVPREIALDKVVSNMGHLSAMLAAAFRGDVAAMGRAVVDDIIEPARAHLIPGFRQVKQAALEAGAYGCSISGAGPTLFAVTDSPASGEQVAQAMQAAFANAHLTSEARVTMVDKQGAHCV